jgi:cytoskeletal protein RodZ
VTPSTSPLPRVATRLATLLAATLLAAACGNSGPTASPSPASAAPSPRSSQAASPSAVPSAPANADLTPVPGGTTAPPVEPSGTPTQTDTAWGRIWDAVPSSFPRLEASLPADSISGPVSAAFVVGAGLADVTATMKRLLDGEGGYRTDQSGPLEDGSFVLDSTGPWEGCRVQTTVTPQSGTTLMTILYGADCPFE